MTTKIHQFDREWFERALHSITLGTASVAGDEFFRSLVKNLALALDARTCFVAEFTDPERKIASMLAFWDDGYFRENCSYPVAGTPCEEVARGEFSSYPERVQQSWPADRVLVELDSECYFGVPALDRHGKVVGHVALLDDDARRLGPHEEWILRVFAARAGAEIARDNEQTQRLLAEEETRQLKGAAHDMTSLFTAIRGYSELVERELQDNEAAKSDLGQLVLAVDRATEICRRLLTNDWLDTEPTQVDVHALVQEVSSLMRPLLPDDVGMRLVLEPCRPIAGDATQLHRALLNLVTNAMRALADGGGTITIVVDEQEYGADALPRAELQPGRYLRISVSDDGVGMDDAVRERLFDPAFTSQTDVQRHGFGLEVVDSVVRSHAGGVEVQSAPGEGARFDLFLPAG